MTREHAVWLGILAFAVICVLAQAMFGPGLGRIYVERETVAFVRVIEAPPIGADADEVGGEVWMKESEAIANGLTPLPDTPRPSWEVERQIPAGEYNARVRDGATPAEVGLSLKRTAGLWFAALMTLCIFSFLYRDNPAYKLAESLVVGVSAGYWMVVGFWDMLIPNLLARLSPEAALWALPGLAERTPDPAARMQDFFFALVPLVLGIMLLWRLAPRGGWIARWPLAVIIGTTAGIRLVGFIHGDFLAQISSSIVPFIVVEDGSFQFWTSLDNILIVVSILCCLTYFFFSIEHTGPVGKVAKAGIWVLMITFGAAFGYTVMGRIALLAIRLEFLMDDWLWLIDPSQNRVIAAAAGG